jgi:hypothetical protein
MELFGLAEMNPSPEKKSPPENAFRRDVLALDSKPLPLKS